MSRRNRRGLCQRCLSRPGSGRDPHRTGNTWLPATRIRRDGDPAPDARRGADRRLAGDAGADRARRPLRRQQGRVLATRPADIGRPVGDNLRELFVSCDPAPALLQQFDHAQPEFIAVHDVGTGSSRKLLGAVAEATGLPVKKPAIRRQGYGTTLATLEFIEFPPTEGGTLRLYCTEVDADTSARHGLARVLLAYSRLGVLMVGDLPGHALAGGAQAAARRLSSPAPGRTATCCWSRSRRARRSQRTAATSAAAPASRSAPPRRRSGRRTRGISSAGPGAACAATSARPGKSCRRSAARPPRRRLRPRRPSAPTRARPRASAGREDADAAAAVAAPDAGRAAVGGRAVDAATAELFTRYAAGAQAQRHARRLRLRRVERAQPAHAGSGADPDTLASVGSG